MTRRPKKRAKSAKAAYDWIVYRMGNRAKEIGRVTAFDEAGARARAIDEFDISPPDSKRLLVRRVGYI